MKEMNMRILGLFGILVVLLTFLPVRADAEPTHSPIVHEELGSILDELATHFRGLGTRLHHHFRDWGLRRKRALITFMLRHKEKLELSPGQVENLKRLRSDFERKAIRRRADIRVAEMELQTLLDANSIDLSQVETKIREIERLRADHRLARIRTIEEGKRTLTPEQRAKLRTLAAAEP